MSETAVSQQAVYSARPTLRLGGQADERVSELLIAMRVTEAEGGMSTAELRFSNWSALRPAPRAASRTARGWRWAP